MIQLMLPVADGCCVKDTVVSLLYDHRGLSAKELWYKINRVKNVSYHGVYKAVCELRVNEVLERKQNKYHINQRWLFNLKAFVERFQGKNKNGQVLP